MMMQSTLRRFRPTPNGIASYSRSCPRRCAASQPGRGNQKSQKWSNNNNKNDKPGNDRPYLENNGIRFGVIANSQEHRIGFNCALTMVKGQSPKIPVHVAISEHHIYSSCHTRYVEEASPMTEMIMTYYRVKKAQPLWCWSVANCTNGDGNVAVVRAASAEKARSAFFHALKAHGYKPTGICRAGDVANAGTVLRGTVRLRVFDARAFMQVDFEKLVEYFGNLIKSKIIPKLRTNIGSPEAPLPHLTPQSWDTTY
ncbi:hypothetical protein B0T24DRAFT_605576 [Lasiosphaeria ovina]|uniref:Uncharacterized protein n=1 Tax=Lasiosphaeria ovina TaxID=92902 RepID=A0AAE0TXU8_9PEZI|nr:hypothetical protein B0T24DRAFT_605576 [Lasiosphaeria ovina]